MGDILIFIIILVAAGCCFILPKGYSDLYFEKYGCGISYSASIILAVAVFWYSIEFESDDTMHTVSLIVLIIACIILLVRLIFEYKRKEVSIKDKLLFTVCQILFSVGSFVLIVYLLVLLLGQSDNVKKKRR